MCFEANSTKSSASSKENSITLCINHVSQISKQSHELAKSMPGNGGLNRAKRINIAINPFQIKNKKSLRSYMIMTQ